MVRGSLTSYTHPGTMDAKLLVLVTCLLVVLMGNQVAADFFYNPKSASTDQLEGLGLKCIPGRTVLKIKETVVPVVIDENLNSDENRRYGQTRRDHMRVVMKDESCSMCVCSTDGKHEYCSNRPAVNVNECLMMKKLMSRFEGSEPFDHERDLSFRIRRDYLWHNDEIPYDQKAACLRGHSYYTNSINANNTDIDLPDEIESLLDYTNKGICQFCVCSTDGREAGCISRNPWFCEYFRYIRTPGAIRDMYRNMFEQDRPAYFRHLSHRLRRTMDDGIYNFIDSGGDTLCCGHPNGHRRQIHNSVRNKLRIMKKKVPKENLLGGGPRGDYEDFIVNND